MVFHNVKGHPDTSVAIGVLASRQRVANLFGVKKEELGHLLCEECAKNPIQPIVTHEPAPCQEVVHRATDPDFDLFKLVPAPAIRRQMQAPISRWVCVMPPIRTRAARM